MGELTPEERAERLLSRLDREGDISIHPDHDERARAVNVVGAEIRAAVEAEREAIAKMLDSLKVKVALPHGARCLTADSKDWGVPFEVSTKAVAEAIRARGKP